MEKNTLDNEILLIPLVVKAASKFMVRHMATAVIIQECKELGKKNIEQYLGFFLSLKHFRGNIRMETMWDFVRK